MDCPMMETPVLEGRIEGRPICMRTPLRTAGMEVVM